MTAMLVSGDDTGVGCYFVVSIDFLIVLPVHQKFAIFEKDLT